MIIVVGFGLLSLSGCSAPAETTAAKQPVEAEPHPLKPVEIRGAGFSLSKSGAANVAAILHNPNNRPVVAVVAFDLLDKDNLLVQRTTQIAQYLPPEADFGIGDSLVILPYKATTPINLKTKVTRQGEPRKSIAQPENITIDELQLVTDFETKAKAIATNHSSFDEEIFDAKVVFFNSEHQPVGYDEAFISVVPANGRTPFETRQGVNGNPVEASVFLERSP